VLQTLKIIDRNLRKTIGLKQVDIPHPNYLQSRKKSQMIEIESGRKIIKRHITNAIRSKYTKDESRI
jgi:hypothetical protein